MQSSAPSNKTTTFYQTFAPLYHNVPSAKEQELSTSKEPMPKEQVAQKEAHLNSITAWNNSMGQVPLLYESVGL